MTRYQGNIWTEGGKDNLKGMASMLSEGDLGLLTNLVNQAFQAVTEDFKPLTEDDTFTFTKSQHLSLSRSLYH